MNAKEINEGWDVILDLPDEGGVMLCPECKTWSDSNDWIAGEIGCELCGSHEAMYCPECNEYIDSIHSSEIQTKRRKK